MKMAHAAWPVFALLALATTLSGCLGGGEPHKASQPPPPPPDPPIAQIMVGMRIPRNFEDEYRFNLSITAPDNTTNEGALYLDFPDPCWLDFYLVCAPGGGEGDFHEEAPQGNSTYPYTLFPTVQYTGVWTLHAERIHSDSPLGADHCITFGFSEPNRTLRLGDGDPMWETPDCIRSGTWNFDYATKNWTLVEGDVKGPAFA